MYNALAIIISFIVPFFILRKDIKYGKNIKEFFKDNKLVLIFYITFFVGFITRLVLIANFPNALNVDEASSGYEAFSILNYGIDRNGNFYPVFLESWGSGQNALYTYLIIPFIKLLGLNILSIRLPMAIIGCTSLIVMYKILKEMKNEKLALIGLIFFSITPWHIMKSRWGLESNIFPDIILYATYFIIKFLKNKKIINMYIAGAFLGISAYAYGTSYFFLPIFVGLILLYLLLKKEITLKHSIGVLFTVFIISLPIILFVIINTFHLKPIRFFITIPILEQNRYEQISSIFNKNFINLSIRNFIESIKIIVKQNDNLEWNGLPTYGITYIITLPFMLYGIFESFKSKQKEKWMFNLWFITAFLLMFVVEPNINRLNIIIIPIIYFTILGISKTFDKIKLSKIFIPIIIFSLFISFEISYYTTNWNKFNTFNGNVENVIKYVDKLNTKKIYFEYSFKEPFIYVCFYNKINTKEFVNTVKYKNNKKAFDSVKSFGKYYFYIPEEIQKDAVYVLKNGQEKKYKFKENEWKKEKIDDFVILTYVNEDVEF